MTTVKRKSKQLGQILIELGYVTTKSDLQSLMAQEWRERTADSIVHAIDTFFTTHLAGKGHN